MMQELKYFKGGAVIPVNGSNFYQKKFSCKRLKKRRDEIRLWTSSSQMTQSEEHQLLTCLCILDQRGNANLNAWRNSDLRSNQMTQSPLYSFSPQDYYFLKKTTSQSPHFFFISFVALYPKENTWKGLLSHERYSFGSVINFLDMATSQDTKTMDAIDKFILFFNDDIPAHPSRDVVSHHHWRTLSTHASHAQRPSCHTEGDKRKNTHPCHQNSHQRYNYLKGASRNYKSIKMKKSVSFDEDVMVYLFDQDSPTLKLHPDFCISQSNSCPCNLQSTTSDDPGLQWDDDFSALENSCHFQYPNKNSHVVSMPTRGWTALSKPKHCSLSQTCLFLTYVTESDLEL